MTNRSRDDGLRVNLRSAGAIIINEPPFSPAPILMASRDFQGPEGEVWTVWDTYPTRPDATAPEYRWGWLAFKTANGEVTQCRLAPIPDGWEQASDERLREYLDLAGTPKLKPTI